MCAHTFSHYGHNASDPGDDEQASAFYTLPISPTDTASMHLAVAVLLAAALGDASPTSFELRAPRLNDNHGTNWTLFDRAERAIAYARKAYGRDDGRLSPRAIGDSVE